jgi:hypothetical protein
VISNLDTGCFYQINVRYELNLKIEIEFFISLGIIGVPSPFVQLWGTRKKLKLAGEWRISNISMV